MSQIEEWAENEAKKIQSEAERLWIDGGLSSNFGETVPLREYQGAYGTGYDIRDCESMETLDSEGVPEELEGFGELLVTKEEEEKKDSIAELKDAALWGETNGSWLTGPHRVVLRIAPGIYDWCVENGYSVDEAYYTAKDVYMRNCRETEAKNAALERAIVRLHREDHSEGDGYALRTATKMLLSHMEELPQPVIFKQTPVTDYRETLVDEELTACQREDAAWMDWEAVCKAGETAQGSKYRCFNSDGTRALGPDEMTEMRRTKEEREETFQAYLAWVQRASARALDKAFGRGGVFWRKLKASRSKCFGDGRKAVASVPWRVWLTKAQVDSLMKAKADRETELVLLRVLKK